MRLEDKITELGFTSEQGKLIRDHIISGNYIPLSNFNELNEQYKSLKSEITDARERLLGATTDAEKARSELKQFKTELKMQSFNRAIDQRILDFASEAQFQWHDPKLVRSLIDSTKVKEMENGSLFGLDDQLSQIRNERGFLTKDLESLPNSQPSESYTQDFTSGTPYSIDPKFHPIPVRSDLQPTQNLPIQGAPPVSHPQPGFVSSPSLQPQSGQYNTSPHPNYPPTVGELIQGQLRPVSQTEQVIQAGKQLAMQKYGKQSY
jgi:hypothetical protein